LDLRAKTRRGGSMEKAERQWSAPGPGPWEVEAAHYGRALPRFGRESIVQSFMKGFAEGTARYGLLLSHFDIKIVHDFWYQQPVAFGAPKGAKGPPPAPVLWLLTRLHPAMRKRIRTCEEAFAKRLWREDLTRWDDEDKPRATARHRELLAVDPASLDDAALVKHLAECEEHLGNMIALHHRYTITSTIPTGDFLVHASDWTGKGPGEVLRLLRGSTPVSMGFSANELEALAAALRDDTGARALLDGDEPAAVLDRLRAAEGTVGAAAKEFLDLVWHRAVDYLLGSKSTGEMPEMVVGAIRAAVARRADDGNSGGAPQTATLRELVPAEHRARFDELLGEARNINRLRDERGFYAECWAVGITRRALLEAGRRLVASGKLKNREHAVDLDLTELGALLSGKSGPSGDEVAERVTWRETTNVADIPPHLGGQPGGPPDANLLPPAARRAARAVDAVLSNLFKDSDRTSTATVVRGISVNQGVYEGTARLITGASEFGRLQQGDVLVTRSTAPFFNVVLPLLGALVTDRGGQLCHAAIVAREYGIPGVVGTKEATRLIPDGARVRVDGNTGEVTILGKA
jgi:pyruvate,water dikinase